jgi:hypothetical protein
MPDNNWNIKVLNRVLLFLRSWSCHLRKTVDPAPISSNLQTKVTYRSHLMNINDINISYKRTK